jgi:FtsZ-interacting cell division protein ZipA
VALLQQVAETLGASCEVPDMMETIARARALDSRCAPLDAMVGINVACASGAWAVGEVVDAARSFGLQPRSDQRLVAYAPSGETLFALQDGEGDVLLGERAMNSTTRVTLLLEVPRVPRDLHPFAQMKSVAQQLAEKLGGVLVDDQLHTLTEAALGVIERQLAPVYSHLEEAGVPAGSPRALALFR